MSDEQNQNLEFNEAEPPIPDGKHLVKKKRRERIVRKGRMKQERFRAFMRFFLSLGLIFVLVYALKCGGWYMDKNAFNPKAGNTSVEIINNKIVPSAKILTLLKNSNVPNVPLYMARTNSIKKDLMKLAPIENVYIRRYAFPGRIQIIIRERTPVITISPDVKAPAAPMAIKVTITENGIWKRLKKFKKLLNMLKLIQKNLLNMLISEIRMIFTLRLKR